MDVNLEKLKGTMIAQLRKNDIVANNLANINITGYKKDVVFLEVLKDETNPKVNIQTDFSQGSLKQTDNPLDLAISGPGFFTIETDQGEAYTRDGHFTVDEQGVLRTSGGNAVLGQGGWINLFTDETKAGEVNVTRLGDIYVNDTLIDTLRITDFEDYSGLRKIGENLFRVSPDVGFRSVEEPNVLQGNLEESNVSAVQEMVNLIEIQRQFESSQRIVKTIDRALGRAVNQVSRFR